MTCASSIGLVLTIACGIGVVLLGVGYYLLTERILRPPFYVHTPQAATLASPTPDSVLWQFFQGQVHDPLTDCGLAYEEVAFPTQNQATIRGWFVPAAAATTSAVVVVHGAWMDRRNFLNRLPMLHRAGYPVLLFDCREHGLSDGTQRGCSLGHREHQDVMAAVRYLKTQRGFAHVGVLGTSQGAASAILAAAQDDSIDAVIAESTFARLRSRHVSPFGTTRTPGWLSWLIVVALEWRLRIVKPVYPLDVVARLAPRPLLLIHGEADPLFAPHHAQQLYDKAHEPKALWLVPAAGHDGVSHHVPLEYEQRVRAFLHRYLPTHLGKRPPAASDEAMVCT
jgi:fermentation-respiration switch protein FrsA (DUF1100 family)